MSSVISHAALRTFGRFLDHAYRTVEQEPVMALQMITANRLSDGAVVYLDQEESWSIDFSDGQIVEETAVSALMESAARAEENCIIVAAYAIAIEDRPDGPRPVRFREQIRAQGPTVRAGRDA